MAKAVRNVVIRGISGNIGELVFRQMPDGSARISAKPDFGSHKFSKGRKPPEPVQGSGGVRAAGSTNSADLCPACGGDASESL